MGVRRREGACDRALAVHPGRSGHHQAASPVAAHGARRAVCLTYLEPSDLSCKRFEKQPHRFPPTCSPLVWKKTDQFYPDEVLVEVQGAW